MFLLYIREKINQKQNQEWTEVTQPTINEGQTVNTQKHGKSNRAALCKG